MSPYPTGEAWHNGNRSMEGYREAGICPVCRWRNLEKHHRKALGRGRDGYRTMCQPCRVRPYTRNKKGYCEDCGFVAEHPVQLDVDHIDGNHENNDSTNLQTLCANCHRLKTIKQKGVIGRRKIYDKEQK